MNQTGIPTLAELRALIRNLNYIVSAHAAEELEDDNLSIIDLENIILSGRIAERQRDAKTREIKFLIEGEALDGTPSQAVVKVGSTGVLVVITVYVC